jgi:hypothetical protein
MIGTISLHSVQFEQLFFLFFPPKETTLKPSVECEKAPLCMADKNIQNLAAYDPFADTGDADELKLEGYIRTSLFLTWPGLA